LVTRRAPCDHYPLSLHDALPIYGRPAGRRRQPRKILPATPDEHQLDAFYLSFENRFRGPRKDIKKRVRFYLPFLRKARAGTKARSEEHTSELQSPYDLVCRLLLE